MMEGGLVEQRCSVLTNVAESPYCRSEGQLHVRLWLSV